MYKSDQTLCHETALYLINSNFQKVSEKITPLLLVVAYHYQIPVTSDDRLPSLMMNFCGRRLVY